MQWRRNEFESGGVLSSAKVGALVRRKASEFFLVVHLFHFFGSAITISCFDERFRDGQYSLASFLFAVLLTVPRTPPFVKVGGHVPHGVGATVTIPSILKPWIRM